MSQQLPRNSPEESSHKKQKSKPRVKRNETGYVDLVTCSIFQQHQPYSKLSGRSAIYVLLLLNNKTLKITQHLHIPFKINRFQGLKLSDYMKVGGAPLTRNLTGKLVNGEDPALNTTAPIPPPRKKVKKTEQDNFPVQLTNGLRLFCLNFVTNSPDLRLRSRQLNRLPKHTLPASVKTIDLQYESVIRVESSQLSLNSKKASTKQWIVKYIFTQCDRLQILNLILLSSFANRLKTVNNEFMILGMQQVAWRPLNMFSFCETFESVLRDVRPEFRQNVFNRYLLPQEKLVYFPVMILQALNFQNAKQISEHLTRLKVYDDKVLLSFDYKHVQQPQHEDGLDAHQSLTNPQPISEAGSTMVDEQNKQRVLVWYIGTSIYGLLPLAQLVHFNKLAADLIQKNLSETALVDAAEQVKRLVRDLNRISKYYSVDLKPDQKRIFMFRMVRPKGEPDGDLQLILRYKQLKQSKQVLVKDLRTGVLSWKKLEQVMICYHLPQFTREELLYLYIADRIHQSVRQRDLAKHMLANFYSQSTTPFWDFFRVNSASSPKQRCLQCKYVLHILPFERCGICMRPCHVQCLTVPRRVLSSGGNQKWICRSCYPCSVCFSKIIDPKQCLECRECHNMFHSVCGKMRETHQQIVLSKYQCENCLKCDLCSRKLKNCAEGYVFLDKGVIYCNDCNSLKEFCSVCKKGRSSDTKTEWIQCGGCSGWVHQTCDVGVVKAHQEYFSTEENEYHCAACRTVTRRKYTQLVIEILRKFDEPQFFVEPDYLSLPDYSEIISNPMCFKTMIQKCIEGEYDTNTKQKVVNDFNLIVSNALEYNMPKDPAHLSARIMKITVDVALSFLEPFLAIADFDIIVRKDIQLSIRERERELFKYFYQHYLEMLLNKNSEKSRVTVKLKNAPTLELPQVPYFKRAELLNQFRSCSIIITYKKESPKIEHLFSLPKIIEPKKISAVDPVCYFHNSPYIISTCNVCMESFCCLKKCILHEICRLCGIKGCRCWKWDCGCKAGYSLKDLEHPNIKGQDILEITEMYKLCIKCSINNIQDRMCKYCSKLCWYDYIKCEGCTKRFHKQCHTNIFIPDHCRECERLPINETKLKQQMKQQIKKLTMKMQRAERYIPMFLKEYLEEGINLNVHQVRQLIFNNFEKLELHYEDIENYEGAMNNIFKIKIRAQKQNMYCKAISLHTDLFHSQLKENELFEAHKLTINSQQQLHENMLKKHFYVWRLTDVDQIVQKIYVDGLLQQNLVDFTIAAIQTELNSTILHFNMQIRSHPKKLVLQSSLTSIKSYLYNQNPIPKECILTIKQIRQLQLIQSRNEQIVRRQMEIRQKMRNLFIELYNSYKKFARIGSTCLMDLKPFDITVYKKWSAQERGIMIRLYRDQEASGQQRWKITFQNSETIVLRDYQHLRQVMKKFRNFETMDELGAFLGFNIYDNKQRDYSYIKFLQTNPLPNASISCRKQKVLEFYPKVKDNISQQRQLFFLKSRKRAQTQKPASAVDFKPALQLPYITFDELKKELVDNHFVSDKVTPIFSEPTKEIFIAPSTIHKLGLFSRRFHAKGTVLIEYVGEILSEPIADVREQQHHLGCYMFGIPRRHENEKPIDASHVDASTIHFPSKRDVIDATFRGNQARYLNHSCDSNCASWIDETSGEPRILIYALRDIQAFQELTYDYQFKVTAGEKIICTCGAKNCQGRLN